MISVDRPCRGALAGAAAMLALSTASATADGDCRWRLRLSEPRSQRQLLEIPLSAESPAFSLSYTHSVFRTEVVSEYLIRNGGIVQTRETFTDPGYGMESSPEDVNGRLEQVDGRLRMELDRPIANLVVRVQQSQNNRITGLESIDLSRTFGDGPIAVRPISTCTPEGRNGHRPSDHSQEALEP